MTGLLTVIAVLVGGMLIYAVPTTLAKLLLPRWQEAPLIWDLVYALLVSAQNLGFVLGVGMIWWGRRCQVGVLMLVWAATAAFWVPANQMNGELLPWLLIAEYTCAMLSLTASAVHMSYLSWRRSPKMGYALATFLSAVFVISPVTGHMGYLMFIEPTFTIAQQRFAWSCGFGFVALCLIAVLNMTRHDATLRASYSVVLAKEDDSSRS